MNWLIWKQQHKQFLWALLPLVAFGLFVVHVGQHASQEVYVSNVTLNIVRASWAVPLLLGMFWGAPLLSKEYDEDTTKFIWTQSVSRRKWLTAKLGWIVGVAGVYGLGYTIFTSWLFAQLTGSGMPVTNRFDMAQFGVDGLMPIFYCMFAVAFGAAIGAWLRKPLTAVGTVLIAYVVVQVAIIHFARPYYMQPITYMYKPATGCATRHYSDGSSSFTCAHIDTGPATFNQGQPWLVRIIPTGGQGVVYQPSYRYWDFQRIEAGIYVALTAVAIGATYWLVERGDA